MPKTNNQDQRENLTEVKAGATTSRSEFDM